MVFFFLGRPFFLFLIGSCFPMIGESFRVIQASLTTKTGHHDIAAILLKVPLSTIPERNHNRKISNKIMMKNLKNT
jgi:hypothetical protein